MILKGSQRGGAGQLAKHLLNDRENDHVTLHDLKGFMAGDLYGALSETRVIAKGTRCRQYMFSLSINPPKDMDAPLNAMLDAAERAGKALGLENQPRAVVIHEKKGRRHIHVVWSRIDIAKMKAINLPFFKQRLAALSKELYLEHGWELPEGHRTNGWKNPLSFTLAEWQQAKRLDLDPREIKQVFQTAWARSDNLPSFRNALEESGYFLARGNRRGFVAVDSQGEVFSVSRMCGIKARELSSKLGEPVSLESVETTKERIRNKFNRRLRSFMADDRANASETVTEARRQLSGLVSSHRQERIELQRKQDERWKVETIARSGRFRRGINGLWDLLSGKARAMRRQNEREAFEGYVCDKAQREALVAQQSREKSRLHGSIQAMERQFRIERLRRIRKIIQLSRVGWGVPRENHRDRQHGLEL